MNICKKNYRLLITLFYLIASSTYINAQYSVSGVVTNSDGSEPLIGATILEDGTNNGTVTDFEGVYSLELKSIEHTIRVSYVGYNDQVVNLVEQGLSESNKTIKLNVLMSENSVLIDQVVVVGYGVQKKSDLTGSVSSLKGEELDRLPTSNIEQALQGKIAGVYVSPESGNPGKGAVVRIRGTGTLNNSNPLYVIDGMITYDAASINPQDVESIEVLKDASAAAIYGSRGANGVIIVTTKGGRKGKSGEISLSTYTGTQQASKYIDLLNASEFARAYNQLRGQNYFINPDTFGVGTDWQKEVLRSAPVRNIQLAASGANDIMRYNISGNYFDQEGILKNTSYNRATIRLNTEFKVNTWFTLGSNAAYSLTKNQNGPNVISSALRMPPLFAAIDTSTGKYTDPTFFGQAIGNPAADQNYKSNNFNNGNALLGNLFGEITFLKNFRFRSNFGYDINNSKSKYFEPIFMVSGSQLNKNDRLSIGIDNNTNWIWEQTINYLKDFGKSTLGVLVGYTAEERKSQNLGASRENFPGTIDELLYISSGNDTTQMNYGSASEEALNSYLFRTNYSFDDKYLFTVSMRVDKSSRFTQKNRTGYFPSASIGWNAGRENFIQNLNLFDRLKVRASYGILGNQSVLSRYPTSAIVTSAQYVVLGSKESINQGATVLSISNENLKWETSKQSDVGVEAAFFDGKLSMEVDWYRRNTYDIIADLPIPDYLGSQGNPYVNSAQVLNSGFDISANWVKAGDFAYNFGVNLSPVSNEVVKLAQGKTEVFSSFINNEPATRTIIGLPIGSFYGYKVEGIFQNEEEIAASAKFGSEKPGDYKYADTNGDGILDDEDRVTLGSPIPTLTYGFNAGASWKGIDASIDFLGVSGNKVFNAKEAARFGVYNWEQHVADAWTLENPSISEPRVTNGGHNYRVSDRYIEDGSFLRLRSISLGYTLPNSLINKINMKQFRIYVSGTNLWTKQQFSGYTPEFPNSENSYSVGFDNGSYPIAKSFQIGMDAKF